MAAPDVPGIRRRDRIATLAAEQPTENGGAVPAWRAEPGDRPVRADQRAALPVGDQGVLTQDMRPWRLNHGFLCPADPTANPGWAVGLRV
jgi:hypothetical protein